MGGEVCHHQLRPATSHQPRRPTAVSPAIDLSIAALPPPRRRSPTPKLSSSHVPHAPQIKATPPAHVSACHWVESMSGRPADAGNAEDGASVSSLELLRRRPAGTPVATGAPPAKRIREREDMKKTLATEWLATAPAEDADLVAQLRGPPAFCVGKDPLGRGGARQPHSRLRIVPGP